MNKLGGRDLAEVMAVNAMWASFCVAFSYPPLTAPGIFND